MVEPEVWIGTDDRTGGKVDTLTHEVATDAALLALEAGADGLVGTARLVLVTGHAGHVVVDVRGHLELQQIKHFVQDVLGSTLVVGATEVFVVFEDVGENAREIVLKTQFFV